MLMGSLARSRAIKNRARLVRGYWGVAGWVVVRAALAAFFFVSILSSRVRRRLKYSEVQLLLYLPVKVWA